MITTTRVVILLGGLALLSACGVDGKPLPPDSRERPPSGIHISGEAKMGIAGGSGQPTRTVVGF